VRYLADSGRLDVAYGTSGGTPLNNSPRGTRAKARTKAEFEQTAEWLTDEIHRINHPTIYSFDNYQSTIKT
jgi:hypothetical protein